jgi:hypothetical protein
MAGINQLFAKIQKLDEEIRHLQGRINAISLGSQIIVPIPGTVAMPPATLGAIPVGNATPAWERLPPPTPTTGQKYDLTFEDGDTKPVWRLRAATGQYLQFVYEVSGGTFTFIIDDVGNPVFTLLDVQ